jgi:hypothetical protein
MFYEKLEKSQPHQWVLKRYGGTVYIDPLVATQKPGITNNRQFRRIVVSVCPGSCTDIRRGGLWFNLRYATLIDQSYDQSIVLPNILGRSRFRPPSFYLPINSGKLIQTILKNKKTAAGYDIGPY